MSFQVLHKMWQPMRATALACSTIAMSSSSAAVILAVLILAAKDCSCCKTFELRH